MTIDLEHHGAVAVLHLRMGKANAMSRALLDALDRALDDVAGADALVITGEGKSFSAGLALPELVDLDRAAITAFITRFEEVMQRVLAFPRATVAAINGHAIAGGCVLALMCDARVMAGEGRIGLNEVQLAIGLPALVVEPLRARMPPHVLGRIALDGTLFAPDEALAVHLVDEVVPPARLLPRALELAQARAQHPVAYAQIKAALLAPVLHAIARGEGEMRTSWVESWCSPDAQATLRAAVQKIGKR